MYIRSNNSKKDGAKTVPPDMVNEASKEPAKGAPKADAKPNGLKDSEVMVLDILKTQDGW